MIYLERITDKHQKKQVECDGGREALKPFDR